MTSVIMLQLIPQVPSNIEYVILIGIILGLSVIAITFLYRYVRRVGAYAYASARVNARKRTLLRGDRLDSLVQSRNVENLISLLGDTPYSKYIGEVGKQKTIELEQSFKKHLADTYVDISRFAPIEIKGIFETILTRFDIQNLRVLFAGVHAGLPSEEIKKKVIPYGNLDMDIFDRSLKSEEFSAAVSVFEETEYWPPISEKLSEFQDTGNLLPLESELEKYYWRKVWSKIRRSTAKYTDVVKEILGMEIDIKNIKIILRCKTDEILSDEIKDYLIPIHHKLSNEIIEEMINSRDTRSLATALEGTPYGEELSEALTEQGEEESIQDLASALDNLLLSEVRKKSIQHYVGIGPLLAFLYEKEIEVRNLTTIINGKSEGLEAEELRSKLITPKKEAVKT